MDTQLAGALKEAGLSEYFDSLPPSHKKEYVTWINDAKKEATKTNRIRKMIEMLKSKQQR